MSNILTNNINPRSGNKITIGGVNDRVSIAGTLTYEDVTSVDSIGIITARSGVEVTSGTVQVGGDPNDGTAAGTKMTTSGVIQSTRASGSGASAVFMGFLEGDNSANFRVNANGSGYLLGNIGIGTDDISGLVNIEGDDFVTITRNSKDLSLNANYSSQDIKAQIQCGAGMSLAFATNGDNQRVVIKSDGDAIFHKKIVVGDSHGGGEILKLMKNSGTSYMAHYNGATAHGFIGYANELVSGGGATDYAIRATNNLLFSTNGNPERMRINTDGDVLIGKTLVSTAAGTGVQLLQGSGASVDIVTNAASNITVLHVYNLNATNNAYRFYVAMDGGIRNFSANNTNLCDEREKKNIETLDSTWSCLKNWELKKFHYNGQADTEDKKYGVIAQQVAPHCPEVITDWVKEKASDAVLDADGNIVTPAKEEIVRMGVKEQQMMWMAIRALQEAQTRIETLEAQVAELQGN